MKALAFVDIDMALDPEEMGHILKIDKCYKSASALHMISIVINLKYLNALCEFIWPIKA